MEDRVDLKDRRHIRGLPIFENAFTGWAMAPHNTTYRYVRGEVKLKR